MKFENFTIESWNSTHHYLVSGIIDFAYNDQQQAVTIELTLEMPVVAPDNIHSITVHNIEFMCDVASVVRNKIYATIKNIDGQQYARQYKSSHSSTLI